MLPLTPRRRLTQFSDTLLGKAVVAVLGVPAAVWVAVTNILDPIIRTFNLPPRTSAVFSALVIALLGLVLWRSYRRFATASRLEQPDAFTLRPTGPASLIDRTEDLERLLNCVKRNRLVLLDGESGCGKSALVVAGVVPQLQKADGLLPVVIRDWGEDWVRGPFSAVLDSLFQSVPQADREKLRWSPPDLAADTSTMAADLDARLKAVVPTLGRRPLLIADQFDDYQAHHRQRFLDGEANWVSPTVLSKGNLFWELVSAGLIEGRLHLLVVTRSDTSAGLACIRFLGEDQTATRTLPRIDVEYLRPLLATIAPDDAQPAVISNPASGWHELRDLLEHDLKAEGAILMQQVRTVLLGLRQLALLTPRRYRTAGGLRGVETLMISHSLRKAADAADGGESGLRAARAMLGALILPGGPNQRPKAQRVSLPVLIQIAGSHPRADAILRVLQDDEVVRPAAAIGEVNAWQLDHDYLATAVLAEARQADRWSVVLREGKARYDEAAGNLRRQWAALLPVSALVRVCWERARGRLAFADAGTYALISAIRPALFLLCLTLIGATAYNWNRNQILTSEATRIVDQFGGSGEADAVLTVWRAPNQVRQRVYNFVYSDRGRLERALRSRWLLADAGLEPDRLRKAAATLRTQLQQEQPQETVKHLAQVYATVASRLADAADLKAEASALRALLQQKRIIPDDVVDAYAGVVALLTDAADVKAEVTALRAQLEQEKNGDSTYNLVRAYKAVAVQLTNAADVKAEAAALCSRLVREKSPEDDLSELADAYGTVASRLTDAAEVRAEATALRVRLEEEKDPAIASSLAEAYVKVASRLTDAADVKAEARALRVRLEQEKDPRLASSFADAYEEVAPQLTDEADVKDAASILRVQMEHGKGRYFNFTALVYAFVASRLKDTAALKDAASALRAQLEHAEDTWLASCLAEAYAIVASQLNDAADLKVAASTLRARLGLVEKENPDVAKKVVWAYAAVVARLTKAADLTAEAIALRAQLGLAKKNSDISSNFVQGYTAVVGRLTVAADLRAEATALRVRLEHEKDREIASTLTKAYGTVASRLTVAADVKAEAAALRVRLEQEKNPEIASSLAEAYATVAVRLNDAADVKDAISATRAQLGYEWHDTLLAVQAEKAYEAVAARLTDAADVKAEAVALRSRMEKEKDDLTATTLADAYATVASRLTDAADVKVEATALRVRLEQEKDPWIAGSVVRAYAAVVARLTQAADVNDALSPMRVRLEHEKDPRIASSLGQAYASVASRLDGAADLRGPALALRALLVQTSDGFRARALARAYAAVVSVMMDRVDAKDRSAWAQDILTMSGHPFVRDEIEFAPSVVDEINRARERAAGPPADVSLLLALKPAAGVDFGPKVGAALRWAEQTYRIRPDQLRPPPVQN